METDQIISSAMYQPNHERDFKAIKSQAVKRLLEIEPDFLFDDSIKPVMRALSLYFSHHPGFEDEGFGKLSKGIFLSGNIGCGKTTIMSAFKTVTMQSNEGVQQEQNIFNLQSTSKIVRKYMVNGLTDDLLSIFENRPGRFSKFCFDDLGVENVSAKYMGNELNLMAEIILSRYENGYPFRSSHFTSNLAGDQIEKIYGTRVRSRLREMCNFLIIPGTDRRK